jgi:phosphoenolpyruvate---glycerone phosphotransferase subunit DhaL
MSQVITLAQLRAWLLRYADRIDQQAAYLTELDAAIGDADHGANMVRGLHRVRQRLIDPGETYADVPGLFRTVAMTLISSIGGAAGPLYGAFFLRAAREPVGNGADDGDPTTVTVAQLAVMFRAGIEGLQQRGKAEPDEKTMLDVLQPAVAALEAAAAAGASADAALAAAAVAAEQGMKRTIGLEAMKGRASYLGYRSVGHQDPGATSSYYLFETLAQAVRDE